MEYLWQLNPAKEKRQCASRIRVIETKRGQTGIYLKNALVHLFCSVFPPPTGNLVFRTNIPRTSRNTNALRTRCFHAECEFSQAASTLAMLLTSNHLKTLAKAVFVFHEWIQLLVCRREMLWYFICQKLHRLARSKRRDYGIRFLKRKKLLWKICQTERRYFTHFQIFIVSVVSVCKPMRSSTNSVFT